MENKRIGILTFQNAYNYGAILQLYGLYSFLDENGYDVQIINYKNEYFANYYIYKYSLFKHNKYSNRVKNILKVIGNPSIAINANIRRRKIDAFLEKRIKMTKWISKGSLRELNANFDIFIVGSDQVWNMGLSDYDSTYFLDFVENDKKRISYAASIGKEYISGFEYDLMEKNFPLYSAISVREKKASELIENYFRIKTDVVLDPTLLRDKEFWTAISNESRIEVKKKYVLIYAVQQPTNLLDAAVKFAEENGIYLEGAENNYISGMGADEDNLISEFDCGSGSGWMYTVRNEPQDYASSLPNVGAGSKIVTAGQYIDWYYTAAYGMDFGYSISDL